MQFIIIFAFILLHFVSIKYWLQTHKRLRDILFKKSELQNVFLKQFLRKSQKILSHSVNI